MRPTRLQRELLGADLTGAALAGALASLAAGMGGRQLLGLTVIAALGWPVLAYVCGLYAGDDLHAWSSGIEEAPRLAAGALFASWPLFAALDVLGAANPARGALVGAAGLVLGVGIGRAAARVRLHGVESLRERVLIVGSGEVARKLVERLREHREFGLEPTGFVDDHAHLAGELDIPCLGPLDAIDGLVANGEVDRVVIAFTRESHDRLLHCLRCCRDANVPVTVVPRLFEFLDGIQSIDQIGGMPLLSLRAPSFSPLARGCKRALDVVGASLILIVLSPLLIAIAVAVRLDSPGPALFTQLRSGRRGEFFRLFKFRSMEVDSTVLVRDSGALLKSRNDQRITRVGRLIRRFSLDEAPQLLNVLRGDMSLVGPRPLVRAEQDALVEPWQSRRSDLRPGLTGPWQVSGRSHLPFDEMIKLDYQYVAGWSLARDLKILLATVPAVISGRGAY